MGGILSLAIPTEMRWSVCLLLLSPLSNDQTHLPVGQWSLRCYAATGFVRLCIGQRWEVPKLHHWLFHARGTVVLLRKCPHILAGTLKPPRTSCLGAAPCSLPIALNGTNALWLTSVPPAWKFMQDCLLQFGLGLSECLSLCRESIKHTNPKLLKQLASISSCDNQPKTWLCFIYV